MNPRQLLIGRDPECNLVVDAPSVSWHHAQLAIENGEYHLRDLGSTNGTWVNGRRVEQARVTTRDTLRVGEAAVPWARLLAQATGQAHSGLLLECVGIEVRGASPRPRLLLDGITFSARGGQLVAVIGPSGAGKTTLLKTLVGHTAPARGSILCNGASMTRRPEIVWSWVGYVPQEDIIHRELIARDALSFAVELRVPGPGNAADNARRVLAAAELCNLTPHLGKRISSLSGGERKRASVAVELLTQPPILIFDEPTSGLDPGLERSFMELCRRLADQGHLVIVTTHVTRSLSLCDRVLLISGGRTAFFGPPKHLAEFFGVDDPADVYGQLDSAKDWPEAFRQSALFRRHVARPISTVTPVPLPRSGRIADWARQCSVLLRRYVAVLQGDLRNSAFLALQAPVIALIIAAVFPRNSFAPGREMGHAASLVFVLVISALWFGTSNSAREIVKEKSIYFRERNIGLSIGAYLLSKLVPLVTIGVLQSLVLALVIGVRTDWYGDRGPDVVMAIWLVLGLTAAAGTALGLLISALATSPDQAISLTPIILLPQLVFSGVFKAVEEGGAVIRGVAKLAVSNWSFGVVGNLLGFDQTTRGTPAYRESFGRSLPEAACVLVIMFVALAVAAWAALASRRQQS